MQINTVLSLSLSLHVNQRTKLIEKITFYYLKIAMPPLNFKLLRVNNIVYLAFKRIVKNCT